MRPGDLVARESALWHSDSSLADRYDSYFRDEVMMFLSENHNFEHHPEEGLDVAQDGFYCTVLFRGRVVMTVAEKLRKL